MEMLQRIVANHNVYGCISQGQLMREPTDEGNMWQSASCLKAFILRKREIQADDPAAIAGIIKTASTGTKVQNPVRFVQLSQQVVHRSRFPGVTVNGSVMSRFGAEILS